MCYCKSEELYNLKNELQEINYQENGSIKTISSKRDKSNTFIKENSKLSHHFDSVIENSKITLPAQIPRLSYESIKSDPLSFYINHVSKGIPCIIKNIANNWPAFSKWQDSNYISSILGEKQITVDITPDGYADSIKNKYLVQPFQQPTTMKDFFSLQDAIYSNQLNYVPYIQKQNNNLISEFEVLIKDIDPSVEDFFSNNIFHKAPDASNLWIGTSLSVTSIHKDNYENIFVVIKGEKHFTLIPPVLFPNLKIGQYQNAKWEKIDDKFVMIPTEGEVPWVSINPDLINDGYEELKYHIIIEPGDCLYLPPLWYHQVSQFSHEKGFIIGVNFWFDMECNSQYVLYDLLRNLAEEGSK